MQRTDHQKIPLTLEDLGVNFPPEVVLARSVHPSVEGTVRKRIREVVSDKLGPGSSCPSLREQVIDPALKTAAAVVAAARIELGCDGSTHEVAGIVGKAIDQQLGRLRLVPSE